MKRFEEGKIYGAHFYFTDGGDLWKCLKRTEKFVLMDCKAFGVHRMKIKTDNNGEYIFGHSMFCYATNESRGA